MFFAISYRGDRTNPYFLFSPSPFARLLGLDPRHRHPPHSYRITNCVSKLSP
jgi:hypothetical protein